MPGHVVEQFEVVDVHARGAKVSIPSMDGQSLSITQLLR